MLSTNLKPALVKWLENAERKNAIRKFRISVYEPEVHRFGGETGMDIAHLFFQINCLGAIEYELLPEEIKVKFPLQLFSVLSLNSLFSKCSNDKAEVWDIWKRLEAIFEPIQISQENLKFIDELAVNESNVLIKNIPSQAAQIFLKLQDQYSHIADCLHAAEVCGELDFGVRHWLSNATIFHWNQLGLTLHELQPMISKVLKLIK